IVGGGTGLYLDSVLRGYDFVEAPEDAALRARLAPLDLEELGRMLLELRPDFHTRSNLKDRERTIRAIEIASAMRDGGAELRERRPPRPDIRPLVIGTTFERAKVRENIAARLRERLDNGMVEEVARLHDGGVPWERLERFGLEYRYCSFFLEGKIATRGELFEKLNIAIRQFAKRQETWFRGMEAKGVKINWLPPVPDKQARIAAALSLAERYFP
ncbi:MAG: tRNA (adenosine(37)-N6)-dimethylallyltransferase MiaA, partial [Treponemataceae bacterium]|nr:tRNA (adenosine(37)-N6)-dimethylallyltransferase MiaA [Treponemataceae bacterium]